MKGAEMTEHAIKIKEVYFKAVLSGEKTFEIRKNDRPHQRNSR